MDVREFITPKSDQMNAEDLIGGPMDVRVADIRRGSAEQPLELHLDGFAGRPFKPCKSVRRLLVACWGYDGATWVGKRMRLYCDESVEWGGRKVGGIRVSHLSDIDRPRTVLLSVKRGRRQPVTVKPLPDERKADLSTTLADLGLTIAQVDQWSVAKGRAPVSSFDPAKQAEVATWLGSPAGAAALQEIRESVAG